MGDNATRIQGCLPELTVTTIRCSKKYFTFLNSKSAGKENRCKMFLIFTSGCHLALIWQIKKNLSYTLRMSDLMAIIGDDANDTQRRY